MEARHQQRAWTDQPARPRVLLECHHHDSPDLIAAAIRRQGFDVAYCTGPTAAEACDLLARGACALVDEADVVVNMLCSETGDRVARAVDGARRRPGVVVEVGIANLGRPPTEFADGVETIATPVTTERLTAALNSALERNATAGPCWGEGV
ncbi:MAG: hypothetical protein V9G12_01975 [Microthrixaceae bacterium]